MNSWGLTDGDLTLNSGVIKINNDLKCLSDRIYAALSTIKGELDDTEQGVDYYNIIFANTPISMKAAEFTRVMRNVDGVKEVYFLDCEKNGGTYSFNFMVQSVYGDISITKSVANNSL